MKIKLQFTPSGLPDTPGHITYHVSTSPRCIAEINSHHPLHSHEWDSRNNSIKLPKDDPERRRELKALLKEIEYDKFQISAMWDEIVERDPNAHPAEISVMFYRQRRSRSFFDFICDSIDRLNVMKRYRTAQAYTSALKSFMTFRQNADLSLNEIDSDLMQLYEAFLVNRGVTQNTISFYMRILRAIYNRAVEKELTPQRNPFRHVYTGIARTTKRALSLKTMQRIKALDLTLRPSLEYARDMFLFSFYTRGMSFIDMAYLTTANLRHRTLSYRRRKTGQPLHVHWERCMQEIIDKYRSYTTQPYLLPILHSDDDAHIKYRYAMARINRLLKEVGRIVGLTSPLTLYVARHSWASIARDRRIPISVISEGMGHDSELTTQIYLSSIENSLVDRANQRILSSLSPSPH